jgi:RimJ/RimL family protein N-acetyltransferase
MEIHTPRLRLRPFVEDDAQDLIRMSRTDQMFAFLPTSERPVDVDSACRVIRGWREAESTFPGFGVWRLGTPDDTLVGSTFLELCHGRLGHFGGMCLPEFWGRGVAFEAGAAVLEHGIRYKGLIGAMSFTHRDNASAQSVLHVCGFVEHGSFWYDDVPVKSFCVGRTAWSRRAELLIGEGLALRPRELLRRLRRQPEVRRTARDG